MLPTHRPPTHPGEMLLKEFLEPLGVSQVEAAARVDIPFQRLNAIVKARRAVSADTALLLDALTGWDAQIWLTLQAKWDLWHALKARGHSAEGPAPRKERVRAAHDTGVPADPPDSHRLTITDLSFEAANLHSGVCTTGRFAKIR